MGNCRFNVTLEIEIALKTTFKRSWEQKKLLVSAEEGWFLLRKTIMREESRPLLSDILNSLFIW